MRTQGASLENDAAKNRRSALSYIRKPPFAVSALHRNSLALGRARKKKAEQRRRRRREPLTFFLAGCLALLHAGCGTFRKRRAPGAHKKPIGHKYRVARVCVYMYTFISQSRERTDLRARCWRRAIIKGSRSRERNSRGEICIATREKCAPPWGKSRMCSVRGRGDREGDDGKFEEVLMATCTAC